MLRVPPAGRYVLLNTHKKWEHVSPDSTFALAGIIRSIMLLVFVATTWQCR